MVKRNIQKLQKLGIEIVVHRQYRIWVCLALAVLALILFEEVADDVFQDPIVGDYEAEIFDKKVAQFVSSYRTPRVTQVMTDLTALGSVSVIVTLFMVLASVLVTYRDYRGLTYITTVLAGAGIWPLVLKSIYERPRPDVADHLVKVSDLSFPSGHSFGAAAVYIALAFYSAQYARTWKQEFFFYILGGVLITLVGVSRIYLGVHFTTDVLGGLSAGAVWAFTVSAGYIYWMGERLTD